MNKNKLIMLALFFAVGVLLIANFAMAYSDYRANYVQYGPYATQGSFGYFDKAQCEAGQDFIIQIAPFGCEPAPVRSDLLEEQNVPVFCQLAATNMNPLIDVEMIDYITITGDYPKEVATVGFYPAQAALGTKAETDAPVLNNIGYAVIVLKKQKNESAMPDVVIGNLTARIRYDISNAFGVGKATFYLPELTDSEWKERLVQYEFWDGRGYLRAQGVDENGASISIYTGEYKKEILGQSSDKRILSTVNLNVGETSGEIYIPGFDYCLATFQVKLDSVENPDTRAKLYVGGDLVEVAEKETFLENRCWINNNGIKKQGINEKVLITCKEDEERTNFNLIKSPKINLTIDGKQIEAGIGDYLYTKENGKKLIYLAYVNTLKGTNKEEGLYAYLVALPVEDAPDKLSDEIISSFAKYDATIMAEEKGILKNIASTIKESVAELVRAGKWVFKGEGMAFISYNNPENVFGKIFSKGSEVVLTGFAGAKDAEMDKSSKEYYGKAMDDYQAILDNFAGEENPDEAGVTLGESALYNMIILADGAGQKKTMTDLCNKFKAKYPNSEKDLRKCTDSYSLANSGVSSREVLIDNGFKQISLEGIYEPTLEEYSAEIIVEKSNSQIEYATLGKGQIHYLNDERTESIQLLELDADSAKLKVNLIPKGVWSTLAENVKSDEKTLRTGEADAYGSSYLFRLGEVNLKRAAKVSVLPNIDYAKTEADFSFKIEIEKRAIELSPEKAKKKIEKLDKDIAKWEGINDKLGSVVKGMKTACLATGAWYTAKNFVDNLGGKGIARQIVMRGANGWYERCADADSQEQCLIGHSEEIDKDVDAMYGIITQQNEDIKKLQDKNLIKEKSAYGLFSQKVVDTKAFTTKYSNEVGAFLGGNENYLESELQKLKNLPEQIDISEITKILSDAEAQENNLYNSDSLKDLELYAKVLSSSATSSELKEIARQELYSTLLNIKTNSKDYSELKSFSSDYGLDEVVLGSTDKLKEYSISNPNRFEKVKDKFSGASIDSSSYVMGYKDKGTNKNYLLVLGKDYVVEQTYLIGAGGSLTIADNRDVKEEDKDVNPLKIGFKIYDSSSYKNEYKNPEVRYYETGVYKGYPAVVPFDSDEGWYVYAKPTLSAFGSISSYDKSGRVMGFYLCNVGRNGMAEYISGDDICEKVNLGTGQPTNQFPGLNEAEAANLMIRADKAVEAAQHYKSGASVSIPGISKKVKIGSPMADIPEMQCQDFMSPKECNILFNLCDPVVCPSSRCDFGGAYPVRDVVQSGVIGSIALCLPNYKEKIYVPVCLTGIHAGIENWISVEKSYRDCLQQNLDTGETIGICDEINSIYMCEFFWNQAIPLAKIGIPKIASWILNQNTRGGGEYLGVADAWANTEEAITYFTQYYAEDSYKAFKARSTEEIGGEACKLFASVSYPNGGGLLDTITTPDSPPQFHGRFDEIEYTTATIPPISQYKVYYYIFAGKDTGAYYRVYLKGDFESSFYKDNAIRVMVATGYVGKGDYASETKDFTAPSGYQELCIMVNGQEECGFKQVATSFAVNYVEEQYLKSQAEQTNITSEEACISGTPSLYSLLNPNVQQGVESVLNPSIYNNGLIRICATENPGSNSDISRWVQVGYCGNQNLKCWLDTESVEEIIKNTNIEEDVLKTTTENYLDILANEQGYLTEEQFNDAVEQIGKEKSDSEKISLINKIFSKLYLNTQKAYSLFLRGDAYRSLAVSKYGSVKSEEAEATVTDEEKAEIEKGATPGAEASGDSSEIPGGETYPDKIEVLKECEALEDADLKVLKAAIITEEEGELPEEVSTCYEAVDYVYGRAGVGKKCVYSSYYSPLSERSQPSCSDCGCKKAEDGKCYDCPREQYDLERGDLVQVFNDNKVSITGGHNFIFDKWANEEKKLANIYHSTSSGKPLTTRTGYDLIKNPVTVIWEPTIKGATPGQEAS